MKCLAIDETPALIDKSIHELQIEIDSKIPDFGKNAYLQSQLTVNGRSFVNSKEFRLRFLRFELFDIQKSAIRMLKWLDLSLGLFGSDALERPIQISKDFSSHELKIFRKGYIQLLPVRASGTGRRIVCFIPYDEDWYTISKNVRQKIMMYTFWIIGNDIDTQHKGVAVIIMFDSSFHKIPYAGVLLPSDQWILAVRMSAIHICTPDTPFFRLRRSFVTMALGSHNRARLKLHLGTSVEVRYKLQVYGIPIECIPFTYTGKIKLTYVRQWLRLRYMIEGDQEKLKAINSNTNINYDNDINIVVESPYLGDVLFKQGGHFASHPGNITLRYLIESKVKQLYENNNNNPHKQQAAVTELKKVIILEIMDEIDHKHRGRFLYWHQSNSMSDCWWVLLDTNGNKKDQNIIFNKIDCLFRQTYLRKQQREQQKGIKPKQMKQQQLVHQKMANDLNNRTSHEKTTIQSNRNHSRISIDQTDHTTINQNGGTLLSNSLDGKHNNTNRDHDSSNGNNGINREIAMVSSSLSLPLSLSSECFGMNFVPCSECSDENIPTVLSQYL